MINKKDSVKELINLLEKGITPFHAVEECIDQLKKEGFSELYYEKTWNLSKGGKYFINHHGSELFAFTVGENFENGQMIRMAGAHTDHPTFRLKPNPDFVTKGYAQLNVEVYGGPILNTWMDRPLGIAGRVAIKSADPFAPELMLFDSKRAIVTIPNLAIHMRREVNDGVKLNPQSDMIPLLGLATGEDADTGFFMDYLAKSLNVSKEDILDFELYLYASEKPELVGLNEELLSAPRIDNLSSCQALVLAIAEGERKEGINLIQMADHEEVGSTSKQGAASILLHDLCRRILRSLGCAEEEVESSLYTAMMVSADVAHAIHPNNLGKADPLVQPVLGKGLCIKQAAAQTYATDAETIAIFAGICNAKEIPFQRFVNRSDMRGGSTIGAISSALLPVKTMDIGLPMLAMHSARELMAAKDMESITDALTAYFMM